MVKARVAFTARLAMSPPRLLADTALGKMVK